MSLYHNRNDDEKFRILVDGGVSATYVDLKCGYPMSGDLKSKLESLKRKHEHIDLLIITHIDDDHIGGLLEWFSHDFLIRLCFMRFGLMTTCLFHLINRLIIAKQMQFLSKVF